MSGFQYGSFGSSGLDGSSFGNKRRSGSDWSPSNAASENSPSASFSSNIRLTGATNPLANTSSPGLPGLEQQRARPSLPSSKRIHSNLSSAGQSFSGPGSASGPRSSSTESLGSSGLYPTSSLRHEVIVPNTPERQFDETARRSRGKKNIVNNIGSLKGYGGSTKASSFNSPDTRTIGKPNTSVSGGAIPNGSTRLFRKSSTSFNEKNDTTPNASFRANSSFNNRKSLSNKKSMLLREDDIPPARSMYDMPRSPERAVVARDDDAETPKLPQLNSVHHSVIVFGYPEPFARAVISHFGKFGRILEQMTAIPDSQKVPSGEFQQAPVLIGPNWVKLTYENPHAARRALEENGTLFSRYYALGVIAATPPVLARYEAAAKYEMKEFPDHKENNNFDQTDISFTSEQASFNGNTSVIDNSSIFNKPGEKQIPRTISMPSLGPNDSRRKLQLHQGQIYPQKKKMRFLPALSNIQQITENVAEGKDADNKSWISWTSKRARELVFGWDDI